jgi:hypothetical protein
LSDRDDDLIKKADALLGRYGRAPSSADADIPVLTEIVGRPGTPGERTRLSEAQIEALVSRVRDEVAASVEAQLHDRLATHLRTVLDTVGDEMKSELEPLVRAAVDEALSRLSAELRGSGTPRVG